MHQLFHGVIRNHGHRAANQTLVNRLAIALLLCGVVRGQDASRVVPDPVQPKPMQKRIFWIIPNYRTTPLETHYHPITAREKFKIARQDVLDPGSFLLAGAIAGIGQATNNNESFGQGTAGYARRYGTAYGDIVIGDYMTAAIVPSLIHQDPRYFRKGSGSGMSRLGHSLKQIVWTRMDSGRYMFNFSEVGGNLAAAGIANAYYPDNRTLGDTGQRFAMQIGLDMAGNILKEFWPDVEGKLHGHKKQP
jgi:hypothetical protein